MKDVVQLRLIKQGIWNLECEPDLNMLPLPACLLVAGSSSHTSRDRQTHSLKEDCAYLANLFGHAYRRNWKTWLGMSNVPSLLWPLVELAAGKLYGPTNTMLRNKDCKIVFVI